MNNLNIENAKLIFKNFAGAEKKFNPAGQRNFNIKITDEAMAQQLINDGWAVKPMEQRDPSDPIEYKLPVKVELDNPYYPCEVVMFCGRTRTRLTNDTLATLDSANIANADIILRPRVWNDNGVDRIKAYLAKAYITIEEDAFAYKYSTFDDQEPIPFD